MAGNNKYINGLALLALGAWISISPAIAGKLATPLGGIALYPELSASATVVSLNHTEVSARILATIDNIAVLPGDEVAAGDILATLECTDYRLAQEMTQAQVESAIADKSLASSQFKRVQELRRQKLTSEQDLEAAEAGFTAAAAEHRRAQAALEQAKLDVSRCRITAPFDAVIVARHAARGQLAVVGTPLLTLIDRRNLELSALISESDADQLSTETAFHFEGSKSYPVVLRRRVNAIDTSSRTQELRLVFSGPPPLPGTAGKLIWHSKTPYLPAQFIISRHQQSGFFTAENGRARFVPLEGAFPGRAHPVSLPIDTLVITAGLGSLQDGDRLPQDVSASPSE